MGFKIGHALLGGAALGPAGGAIGALLGGGDDYGKKQLAQALDQYGLAQNTVNLGTAQAMQTALRQVPAVKAAYKSNRENAISLADRTKRLVTQNLPAQLSAAGRAIDNTGFNGNLDRLATSGVRGDYGRALSSIDDFISRHIEAMNAEEAGTLGGIYSNVAGLQLGGAQSVASIYGNKAATIAGVQHTPKPTIFDLLGSGVKLASSIKGLAT